jgi:hypothetical protein
VYRKAHLFDLNIPEKGIRLMESDYVLPGQMILPPVKTPVGNLGLSIVSFSYVPAVSRQAVFCACASRTGYEKNELCVVCPQCDLV